MRIAGREGIRLRARARPGRRESIALFRLGAGADAYELAVDAERGILLREVASLDGADYSVTEVVAVAFDESFPPETFTLAVAGGETSAEAVPVEEVSLAEAARRAPFPVWAPRELAEGWRTRTTYFPGNERSGDPPTVAIRLFRDDASHTITVVETPGDADRRFERIFTWVRVERGGEEFDMVEERGGRMPTRIRLEREGTGLMLDSSTYGVDALIAFARSFVRVARVGR